MRHFEGTEQVPMGSHEIVESCEVILANEGRGDHSTHSGLQVLENVGIIEGEFQFIAVQYLENDHFVTMKTQLFETKGNIVGGFQQVCEKQNHTATMNQANCMLKQLDEARSARSLKLIQMA